MAANHYPNGGFIGWSMDVRAMEEPRGIQQMQDEDRDEDFEGDGLPE